jgi:hypothetical protein
MAGAKFQGPKEWDEWTCWLVAGLHGRNPWRLPVLLMGILFAQGRRTVSTWPRAAGVSPDYEDYYYFLASVGRNAQLVSWRLLSLVLKIVPLASIPPWRGWKFRTKLQLAAKLVEWAAWVLKAAGKTERGGWRPRARMPGAASCGRPRRKE